MNSDNNSLQKNFAKFKKLFLKEIKKYQEIIEKDEERLKESKKELEDVLKKIILYKETQKKLQEVQNKFVFYTTLIYIFMLIINVLIAKNISSSAAIFSILSSSIAVATSTKLIYEKQVKDYKRTLDNLNINYLNNKQGELEQEQKSLKYEIENTKNNKEKKEEALREISDEVKDNNISNKSQELLNNTDSLEEKCNEVEENCIGRVKILKKAND